MKRSSEKRKMEVGRGNESTIVIKETFNFRVLRSLTIRTNRDVDSLKITFGKAHYISDVSKSFLTGKYFSPEPKFSTVELL